MALTDGLYQYILDKGLDMLILSVEKSEARTTEYIKQVLKDHDIKWLPNEIEENVDEALAQAAPKLFQLIVDGLKLLKASQIHEVKPDAR